METAGVGEEGVHKGLSRAVTCWHPTRLIVVTYILMLLTQL